MEKRMNPKKKSNFILKVKITIKKKARPDSYHKKDPKASSQVH
jgi:hypothetical protein